MIKINNKSKCCGCEACANICTRKCISMKPDNEGFLYPEIDFTKCVNCSLCEKICPFLNYHPTNGIIKAYAAQIQNINVLSCAASGGVYSAIAHKIVSQGGIACGASFYDGKVQHTFEDDEEKIYLHSSSKYVQSRINRTYLDIEKILKNEPYREILFSGTPCQVAALKNFLGKEYEKLYTIDVLCAGVSSPLIFDKYLELMTKKFNSKVREINFKKKTYGYHSSTMTLLFDNGKKYSKSRLTDPMMRVYTAHIADRPSCASCVIKGEKRHSDLTIFDCWHFSELTGKSDNNLGYSNILVHTQKGIEMLNRCNELMNIIETNIIDAISLDGNMVWGKQIPCSKRNEFFAELNVNGLLSAIKLCVPITIMNWIKEYSKGVLYKFGLLEKVKKLERSK